MFIAKAPATHAPADDRLRSTRREIARIEEQLHAVGDRAALASFGDPEHGASIAALLGYRRLARSDARVVAQLSRMPDAFTLVREYLSLLDAAA